MEITKEGIKAQTAEEINALVQAEQQKIYEAERERVKRDKERKEGGGKNAEINSSPVKAPAKTLSTDGPKFSFDWGQKNAHINQIKGTIILEGYYTIDDLKKYISLLEKYL